MGRAEFVNSYFNAWNHRDPEEVAAHLARNGRYCDIPQQVEWTYDELIANLERFFAIFQHRYELIGRVLTSQHAIAYQYRMIPWYDEGSAGEATYHGAEFIQPGLTLPRLAAAVDCSVNHLSQVINSGFHMSFFDYLNKYRVEWSS